MLEHSQPARHLRLFAFIWWLIVIVAGTIGNEKHPRVGQGACSSKRRLATNKNSFSFRRLGNGSRLEDCIDFCCRDGTCELAMFSRFHCFGVSCHKPALCHQILDHLLMEDEKQLKRNPRNAGTRDFIRHTSQVAKASCPQRFVPSFHLFLLESGPHVFRLLHGQPKSTNQCSADCCESRDCLLSFIEDSKCYGVIGRKTQENGTNSDQRRGFGLQVAVIDRNKEISRSLIDDDGDDTDDDPDELGSDESDRTFSTTKHVSSTRQEVHRLEPFDEHSSGQTLASFGVAKTKKGEDRNVSLRSTKVPTIEHSNGNFSTYKVKTSTGTTVSTISKRDTYKPQFQRPTKPSDSVRSKWVLTTKSARRDFTTLSKPKTFGKLTTSLTTEMKSAKTTRTHRPSRTVKIVATQSDAFAKSTRKPRFSNIRDKRISKPTANVRSSDNLKTSTSSKTFETYATLLPAKIQDASKTISPTVKTERMRLPVTTMRTQSDAFAKPTHIPRFPEVDNERIFKPTSKVRGSVNLTTFSTSKTFGTYTTLLPLKIQVASKTLSPTLKTERTHLPSKTVTTVTTQSETITKPTHILRFPQVHSERMFKPTSNVRSNVNLTTFSTPKTFGTYTTLLPLKIQVASKTLSPTIKTERTRLPSKTVKTLATKSDSFAKSTRKPRFSHIRDKRISKPTANVRSSVNLKTSTSSKTFGTYTTLLPARIRVASKTLSPTLKTERTHLPSKTVTTVTTQSETIAKPTHIPRFPEVDNERIFKPTSKLRSNVNLSTFSTPKTLGTYTTLKLPIKVQDATKTLSPTIKTDQARLPSSTVNITSATITKATEKLGFPQRHDKNTFKPTAKVDSSDILTTFPPSIMFGTFTKPLPIKGQGTSKAVKAKRKRLRSRIQGASKTRSSTVETDRTHLPRKNVKAAVTRSGATTKPILKSGLSEYHDNRIFETMTKIRARTTQSESVQKRSKSKEKNDLRTLLKTLFSNTHFTKDVRKETKAVQVAKHSNKLTFANRKMDSISKKWTIPHDGVENKRKVLHEASEYNAHSNGPLSFMVRSESLNQKKTEDTVREAQGKKQETKKVDLIKDLNDLGSGEDDGSSFSSTEDGKLDKILPLLDEERSNTKIQEKFTTADGGHKVPERTKIQENNQGLNEAQPATNVSHDELRRNFSVVRKNGNLSKPVLTTNHSFVDQTASDDKRRGRSYGASFAKEGQIHKNSGIKNVDHMFSVGNIRETTSKKVRKGEGDRKRTEIFWDRTAAGGVHRRPTSRRPISSSFQGLRRFQKNVGQRHKVEGLDKDDKSRNRAHWTRNSKLRDGVEQDFKQLNQKHKPAIKDSNGKLNATDGGYSIVAQLTASLFEDKNTSLPLPLDSTVFIGNDHQAKRMKMRKKKNGSAPGNMRFKSMKSSGLHRRTKKPKAKYTKSETHRKINTVVGINSTKSRPNLLQSGSSQRNPSVFGEDEDGNRTKTNVKLRLQIEMDEKNEKKKAEEKEIDLMQYASSENSGEELVKDQPSENRHIERYVPTAKTLTGKKTTSNSKGAEKARNTSTQASNKRNASHKPYTSFQQLPTVHRDNYTKIQSNLTEGNHQILEQFTNSTELKLKGHHALRGNRSISLNPSSAMTEHSGEPDAFAHGRIPSSLQPTTPNQMKSLSWEKSYSHEKAVTPPSSNFSSKVEEKKNNQDHSGRRFSNSTAEILAHFFADGSADDGIQFSVGSGGKHHKGKKSSKSSSQRDDSLDVEDLGDADFDIMMSNDIPRKEKPQKGGTKTEHHKQTDKKKKGRGSKERKPKKRVKSKQNVLDEDDEKGEHPETKSSESENGEETDKKKSSDIKEVDNTHKSRYRHKKPKESSQSETEDQIVEDKHKKHKVRKGKEERGQQSKDNVSNSGRKHSRMTHHHKHVEDEDNETSQRSRDNGQETVPIKKRKKHTKRYQDNKWKGKRIPGKFRQNHKQEGENEKELLGSAESQGDDKNGETHKKHQRDHPHERKQKARMHGKNEEGKKETKKRRRHGHFEGGSGNDNEEDVSKRHQYTPNEKHQGLQEDQEEGENDDKKFGHRNNRKGNHNIAEQQMDERYREEKHKGHKRHKTKSRERSEKRKNVNQDKEKHKKHEHHRGENKENTEEGTKAKSNEGKHGHRKHHRQENHEHTEKRTDVANEVVKKRRHSLHRHEGFLETEGGPYDKQNDEEDGSNGSEPDDKEDDENAYDENSGHENRNNDEDDEDESKKEEDDSVDDDQSEARKKGSRSFLGEDSDDDTENEEISVHHRRHRKMHGNEKIEKESDGESHRPEHRRERYREEENKRTSHHHSYGHRISWSSGQKQRDSDKYGYEEEENEQRNARLHSRKSSIHRERNEEDQEPEERHGRTRHMHEQKGPQDESDKERNDEENRENTEYDRDNDLHEHYKEKEDIYRHHDYNSNGNPKEGSGRYNEKRKFHEIRRTKAHKHKDEDLSRDYESQRKHYDEENDDDNADKRRNYEHDFHDHEEKHGDQIEGEVSHRGFPHKFSEDGNAHGRKVANTWHPKHHHFREKGDRYEEQFRQNEENHIKDHLRERDEHARPSDWEGYNERDYRKNRHNFHRDREHDIEESAGSFDSSSWMFNEAAEGERFYGGESNHGRHGKKHRKHRQSYEYWRYGQQYPSYYDYGYSKRPYGYDSSWASFQRIPEWQKQPYPGNREWKPSPSSHWNPTSKWGQTSPWGSDFRWSMTQTGKPREHGWQTAYDDGRGGNMPTPRSGALSTSWGPTPSRWQQGDLTSKDFREGWSHRQTQSGEKQYKDWSGYQSPIPTSNWPQENVAPGTQPWKSTVDENGPTPQGRVQSKYFSPGGQQNRSGFGQQARFRPTIHRQYLSTVTPQTSKPDNISKVQNIMDKLNLPLPAAIGNQAKGVPTVNQVKIPSKANNNVGQSKANGSDGGAANGEREQNIKRLHGFFNEEGAEQKKSRIEGPSMNSSDSSQNVSSSVNGSKHNQLPAPKSTSTPLQLPQPQPTAVSNKTTPAHTTPPKTTAIHISRPTNMSQNVSTTAMPVQKTTSDHPSGTQPFGDVSQPDESSEERGKKHRKHRAPVCMAGKITDDLTLLRGKRAGNFTNIGDVGDFEMCIKRCCQHKNCDLAFKSAETCFLVHCFSKESCQTSPTLDDIFSPRMCVVKRHLSDEEDQPDEEGGWNDKVSPSGIHEVCDAERALGIHWKKTVAGRSSKHPCPREAKGFVQRKCEADSRWLPPDFSECVSADYQNLYEKSKRLAVGADPSPLIRELSQLTTQNIDNSLIFGGDLDRATDIMAAIVQHNGQTDLLDMTREDVENFVRASSNLLDMTNQQEWSYIQMEKPGSADVLRLLEMFALQAAIRLPREDMTEPTITNNIIIKMDRKSAGDEGLTFPDFSNPKVNRWDARHDVIALPASVFDRGEVSTASISFKSLPYLLPDSNVSTGLGPNSKVISTVMHPHPQEKITPPVTVVLSHIKRRRGNPKCVFWDYTLNPHKGGAWSSRGCWLAYSNQSHSICQCSHLSNFAVLMDLSSDEVSQKEQKKERTMALMWIGIPVLIVGVIGALYMSFSWNRKSGITGAVKRPAAVLNEKTGLLGQRVVTSQVREEFPSSPSRDLYRALSPGYSPTSGDLEWQDEFDLDVESSDHGFKRMLIPRLQLLQKQLINEFYEGDKTETKRQFLESKIQSQLQVTPKTMAQTRSFQKLLGQKRRPASRKHRVRFADERLPRRNLTDDDKQRFKRLQKMERRVFIQHLSRWRATSHLNLSD